MQHFIGNVMQLTNLYSKGDMYCNMKRCILCTQARFSHAGSHLMLCMHLLASISAILLSVTRKLACMACLLVSEQCAHKYRNHVNSTLVSIYNYA